MAIPDISSKVVNDASAPVDPEQQEQKRYAAQPHDRMRSSSSPTKSLLPSLPQQDGKSKLDIAGEEEENPKHTAPPFTEADRELVFDHDDQEHDLHEDQLRALEEDFSKLNPYAKEFIPSSFSIELRHDISSDVFLANGQKPNSNKKKKKGNANKRHSNTRLLRAQWDESIRRTVYVSDIDQQVTEEQLAALFLDCGQVVDCRVCGDPNSVLRFAFVEFTDEGGAHRALCLSGTMLGFYPVRVLPSKTAILPVNPTFLPQSEDEREMCARTIYCTNIDKKITHADVKLFFESLCGEVARLRLLGEYRHSTCIAFVEFVRAESAIAALNCSGAVLGSLPIRVSPSKTPVRPCMTRTFLI